jgi:type I restriction enzyme M protein
VRAEHEGGAAGRFAPGLPRISDGQLLFLLHILAHAKAPADGGARVAIIMNGSPLFTGDAGSGESEIRRHLLENDLLEALIALPEQLFYNTGIATYVWVVTNRKAPGAPRQGAARRRHLVLDADAQEPRRQAARGSARAAQDILQLLDGFRDGETRPVMKDGKTEEVVVSRVFPTTHFGFRKITVERPLRLAFQATQGFQALAQSKKKSAAGAKEQEEGRALQEKIRALVRAVPDHAFQDRAEFEAAFDAAAKKAALKLPAPARKAILSALSERDEAAAICREAAGAPEADPELRDTESVPLPPGNDPVGAGGVPASVRAFFDREVTPHVPDAWIDTARRDDRDGKVGVVGYEINFNRYFYRYVPPRPLEVIEAEIREIEKDIVRMLGEVTGAR